MDLPELELADDQSHYLYDGVKLDRVTQIISRVFPPYLVPWAENVGQAAALKLYQRDGELPGSPEVLKQEIRQAGFTCEDEKVSGQNRGAAVHLAIEAMVRTGEPALDLDDFENPEHQGYARSFAAWMVDYRPEFLESEIQVCHPDLGFAGTFDGIVIPRARPKGARGPDVTGKKVLIDYKTNKAKKYYDSHLYQLAAYELALNYWEIEVDAAAVIAIGPGGGNGKPYSQKVNYIEPEAFRLVAEVYRMMEHQKTLNPLGRAKK